MKKSQIKIATLAICSVFTLTSCNEILGIEDNPASSSTTNPYDDNSEIIQFKDSYAEGILVQYFDKNGDFKLSMKEAQAVYDLRTIFTNNKNVKYLDELQYFTRLSLINEEAFDYAENLISITIPGSVSSIAKYSFSSCYSLENVTLMQGIKEIGTGAFAYCYSLESIVIPSSVESIKSYIFDECPKIKSIKVESGNTYYDSRDNCNCIIETATNKIVQGCSSSVIPDNIQIIGSRAFHKCNFVTLVVPEKVERIEEYAFYNCTELTTIELPSTINYIGGHEKSKFGKLTKVIIKAKTPPTIGELPFGYGANLKIYVPSGSVDAYKSDAKWSVYADKIQAIE